MISILFFVGYPLPLIIFLAVGKFNYVDVVSYPAMYKVLFLR